MFKFFPPRLRALAFERDPKISFRTRIEDGTPRINQKLVRINFSFHVFSKKYFIFFSSSSDKLENIFTCNSVDTRRGGSGGVALLRKGKEGRKEGKGGEKKTKLTETDGSNKTCSEVWLRHGDLSIAVTVREPWRTGEEGRGGEVGEDEMIVRSAAAINASA